MRTERELLVDCVQRLNRVGLPYMLVGSMASNFWGIPRTTHDLDVVLVLDANRINEFAEAFESGFFVQRESIRNALAPPYQFNAIDEQSAMKVDFWIRRNEPYECAAFDRRTQVELFGAIAWIATAEDVILHKLYWHKVTPSDRQLTDAAGVVKVQADALDSSYLQKWAKAIGVEQELNDLVSGKTQPKST
jgi:hypothetical protein